MPVVRRIRSDADAPFGGSAAAVAAADRGAGRARWPPRPRSRASAGVVQGSVRGRPDGIGVGDGKTFADATPNAAPEQIQATARTESPNSTAALRRGTFSQHRCPRHRRQRVDRQQVDIAVHIDRLWDQLTRRSEAAAPFSSLLPLPQPYVVPGGRFRNYYWDCLFHDARTGGKRSTGSARIPWSVISPYSRPCQWRTHLLSEPFQPPFFFEMVGLLSREDAAGAFARYLPQLRREYAFWMEGAGKLRRGGASARRAIARRVGPEPLLGRSRYPRDESYRDDVELPGRAAALHRSIGTFGPRPRAAGILARVGSPTDVPAGASIRPKSSRSI